MSGRCKACDKKLSDYELKRKVHLHASDVIVYSDLCTNCQHVEQEVFFFPNDAPIIDTSDEQ